MSIDNTNSIIHKYLTGCGTLTALVGDRIYCPRLPENATLPALGFFTRGGTSTPYIPGLVTPSVQFDCWADNPIGARAVYNLLYDNLQGIQEQSVTIGADTYMILSAVEEVQGQDIVDLEIQNYFRVITYFSFIIRAEA